MQDTVTRCLGLVTQYNPLSLQPGALVQADDCVIRRENTVENRRGYGVYGAVSSAPSQLTVYSSRVVALYGSTLAYDNGSGTFTPYAGTYSAPTGATMRSVEANSNLYITTNEGVKVLTDVAGTAARRAGAPRSLDPSGALDSAADGFLGYNKRCAYCCVIQRTDANGNVLFSYPSTRLVVANTSGNNPSSNARNVRITVYLPAEVTTSDVLQFYRTEQADYTASDNAGDEMGLVYQVSPDASDIANKYLTFIDVTSDDLRGATLYTSPSQEGIAQANERPPLAKDIALFKGSMFYANTSTKQRISLSMVGTSGLSGKSLTIAGVTYTFGATEIISGGGAPQVQVYSTGLPVTDLDETARSLVRVINRYAGNTTIYAYYLSGPDDTPGQFMLEERGVGGSAFTIQCSASAISALFSPVLPVSPATSTAATSTNDNRKNALYFSKPDEPEHVPLLNYLFIGAANKAILRIAPLRDSLIIVKEEGVWRLTGESPSTFTVSPLDQTVFCKGANSVSVLANQVFMLSNQGVVAMTDTGVQVISRDIEPSILPLLSFANLSSYTVGLGYESERSYLLSTMTTSSDTAPTQIFCYNIFTKAWTRWTFAFSAAAIEPTVDRFFFAKPSESNVYRERKDFLDTDYADPEYDVVITEVSGTTVTLETSATILPGWVLSQNGTQIVIEEVLNTGANWIVTLVYDAPVSWTDSAATLYPSVQMDIQWAAWSAGQSGLMKHVRQIDILTDNITGNNNITSLTATFKTDLDGNEDEVAIDSAAYRWDSMPWGVAPWGGVGDTYAYPTYVPRNKQYCRILNLGVKHTRAREHISISGASYTFELITERVSK